ncbi:MAG: pyrroline-5-carboxylate reductase [Candidatus Omnitrophica bacterium]|nr:pyrroline-5-carboxylate reductase [Candidatus Omnitrophota bacterium]
MQKIGIIGYGNMGSAIGERLKSAYRLYVFDKDKAKTGDLADIYVSESIADLLANVDAVLLAVKPQDFDSVLEEIGHGADALLVISIAAGITTNYIERYLGKARIIRAMPNIGAKISQAETCIARGASATDDDLSLAEALFRMIGKTWRIGEDMMDAATAISGSGPAYIFYDIEKENIEPSRITQQQKHKYKEFLKDAAVGLGFSAAVAADLASSITQTSLNLMILTPFLPSQLRNQVTSRGGTTDAAIQVLMNGGSWQEAARAAEERAKQLSRKD